VKLGVASQTLANAHDYLNMTGYICIAWMWLRQETQAMRELEGNSQDEFLQGKVFASRYFFAHELPKTQAQYDLLSSLDKTTSEMKEEFF